MAIRIVIAGLGLRGREWAAEIKRAQAFEIVGYAEPGSDVIKRATEAGIDPGRCFPDLRTAITHNSGCDAVLVATPAETHHEVCEEALSYGLAVLVEKPFVTSFHDAVRLVALADARRLPLLVAQNYRYMRAFRTARTIVQNGTLGQIGLVVCQYYRVPHAMAPSHRRLSHSALLGVGVHHLDALRFVLGQEAVGVYAESFSLPWGSPPSGASVRALMSFSGDARAFYTATYQSSGHEFFEGGQEFYCRFVGTEATLHVFHRWLVLCPRGRLPRLIRRGPRPETEEQILLRQFERAIRFGESAEVSGRDNLQTMAIVEACLQSNTRRAWVNPQALL